MKDAQFSGLEAMSEEVRTRFANKIAGANSKWATDEGLKKHGLEREEGVEEEMKKKVPKKKQKTKK
jgi:hypothetical protein